MESDDLKDTVVTSSTGRRRCVGGLDAAYHLDAALIVGSNSGGDFFWPCFRFLFPVDLSFFFFSVDVFPFLDFKKEIMFCEIGY